MILRKKKKIFQNNKNKRFLTQNVHSGSKRKREVCSFKGLYLHNFERALKSMTCVQIGRIHIDGFKNVQKKFKVVPCCHGNQPKSLKYLKLEK